MFEYCDIRILSFILSHKSMRRNSCIYAFEKKSILAKKLDMAISVYSKYLKICKEKGLFNPANGSFVSIRKALKILFPNINFRGCDFFHKKKRSSIFKYWKETIEFALLEVNYKKQQYSAECKNVLTRAKSNSVPLGKKDMKLLKKMKKHYGVGSVVELECIVKRNEHIVTGKNHVASILHCSPSQGANLLSKWHKRRKIHRQVIRGLITAPQTQNGYLGVLAMGLKHIWPSKNGEGYCYCIGSQITLL